MLHRLSNTIRQFFTRRPEDLGRYTRLWLVSLCGALLAMSALVIGVITMIFALSLGSSPWAMYFAFASLFFGVSTLVGLLITFITVLYVPIEYGLVKIVLPFFRELHKHTLKPLFVGFRIQ